MNGLVGVNARAVPDLLLSEVDVHDLVGPGYVAHRARGDQYLAAAQPSAGLDNHVHDGPALVVKIDVLDAAELAVAGAYRVAFQFLDVV